MRLIDLLEAPISDYSYTEKNDAGMSFTPPEQKILSSEKGKQRFIKAFERTPFDFRVMFWNTNIFDATTERDNNNAQDFVDTLKAGIYSKYNGVKGSDGIITVIILGNLSPEFSFTASKRIPMTPWILAHKIGHGLQDHASRISSGKLFHRVKKINEMLIDMAAELEAELVPTPDSNHDAYRWSKHFGITFQYPETITKTLTIRSQAAMADHFEIFPELIAQYLITGKITLNASQYPILQDYEKRLNENIFNLLKLIEGKIIVEF